MITLAFFEEVLRPGLDVVALPRLAAVDLPRTGLDVTDAVCGMGNLAIVVGQAMS